MMIEQIEQTQEQSNLLKKLGDTLLDTTKTVYRMAMCKGNIIDRTRFDYSSFKITSQNRHAIIEHFEKVSEKGVYAILRISAIAKLRGTPITKIAFANANLRNNIASILKQKANELRTKVHIFAFSVDASTECKTYTASKISNWILIKLDNIPEDSELFTLFASDKRQFISFLSSLLAFASQGQVSKHSLADALSKGHFNFNRLSTNFLTRIKEIVMSAQDLSRIPVIRQVVGLAPTIARISNTIFRNIEVESGKQYTTIYDVIEYDTTFFVKGKSQIAKQSKEEKPLSSDKPKQPIQTTPPTTDSENQIIKPEEPTNREGIMRAGAFGPLVISFIIFAVLLGFAFVFFNLKKENERTI